MGLLLQSRFPMFVAWGPDLGFLYNDPYAEILGAKHLRALGSRFYDIWSEIWPDISPLIDAALAGEATYREDLPLVMNRARVFEPFFTTKDISKGSGLGLPQVYGFVQQSAGRVEIASDVGVGTMVTLLLPGGVSGLQLAREIRRRIRTFPSS